MSATWAGFTHRHTPQPAPDLDALDLTAAPIAEAAVVLADRRGRLTRTVARAQLAAPARATARAWEDVAHAERDRDAAVRDAERAIRAANPTATEAAIHATTRAL